MITRSGVPKSIFTLDKLELPPHIIRPWLRGLVDRSVVAALAPQITMPFGDAEWFSFSDHEAQYVGEGQAKAGSVIDVLTGYIRSYKFQKTVRLPVEKLWESEAYQLDLVGQMLADMRMALARALDYGVIHGIDPRSGVKVERMTPALDQAPLGLNLANTDVVYDGIDAAVQKVLAAGYVPNGIALDAGLAGLFATVRDGAQRIYPNFNLTGESTLDGLRAAVSRTVGAAGLEKAPNGNEPLAGIVGDWDAVRWGVQRTLRTETFDTGNPDNVYEGGEGRDLAGYNEIAFRVEIVYGWGIGDLDAFALLTGKPTTREGLTINATNVTVTGAEVATTADQVAVEGGVVDVHGDQVNVDGGGAPEVVVITTDDAAEVEPEPVTSELPVATAPVGPFAKPVTKRTRK